MNIQNRSVKYKLHNPTLNKIRSYLEKDNEDSALEYIKSIECKDIIFEMITICIYYASRKNILYLLSLKEFTNKQLSIMLCNSIIFEFCSIDIIKLFLDLKADPNFVVSMEYRRTALMLACSSRSQMELLIQYGADPTICIDGRYVIEEPGCVDGVLDYNTGVDVVFKKKKFYPRKLSVLYSLHSIYSRRWLNLF